MGGYAPHSKAERIKRRDTRNGVCNKQRAAAKHPAVVRMREAPCAPDKTGAGTPQPAIGRLYAQSCTSALCVQYSTANSHMTSLYRKLEVNSRAELIIRYREASIRLTEAAAKDTFHAEKCFYTRK